MKAKQISTLINTIVLGLFLLAITIPLVTGVLEADKQASATEKRTLAVLPAAPSKLDEITSFPKRFDQYYADHFGLRAGLTTAYNFIKYGIGDSASIDVTIGQNGWLFLGSVKKKLGDDQYLDPMGDARNANLYSNAELDALAAHLTTIEKWLAGQGIEYMLVITPNKHTVYFDQLPAYVSKVNKHSATDQLVQHLKAHTQIHVVDLRPTLLSNKQAQLYYKTDSHWNHNGR